MSGATTDLEFAELTALVLTEGRAPLKRGPKPQSGVAMSSAERSRKSRAPKNAARLKNIAVLDMETDPFDNIERGEIHPFCAELYSDQFGSIVIWEENADALIQKIAREIEALPGEYTIYAHNGGKFDFMFLVRHLRGTVKFKGRAIMAARIGNHELRDSLHLLPERLAAWKKEHFDYSKMKKSRRRQFKDEILKYLHSDCIYLFSMVRRFIDEFGLKISIGQAATAELRKHYKLAHIKPTMDAALRPYFFGGRVECIAGRGIFDRGHRDQTYKLYDVNSMYPFVMANFKHPTGAEYLWRRGVPGPDTFFVDLTARNFGALVSRGDLGEASAELERGRFKTTIWEYNEALKHDLLEDVEIHWCIDNPQSSDFSKFIVPMYGRRQQTKPIMRRLKEAGQENSTEYEETKKEDLLLKYLLNNSWGKQAQNPENFKEYYYTDAGQKPPNEWFEFMDTAGADIIHKYGFPVERCETFEIWCRPSPGRRYNNVGTGASITGAARAVLMGARQIAIDPIYCDTDSLICRALPGLDLDGSRLGAWDLEETFDEVIITGKKQYACKVAGKTDGQEGRLKVRCKGADLRIIPLNRDGQPEARATAAQWQAANAATWRKFEDLLDGQIIEQINKAPTMTKTGEQYYITRRIRATAPFRSTRFLKRNLRRA